jgi:D-alanine-D-alanine ligase-like ATP-grasp enzyme
MIYPARIILSINGFPMLRGIRLSCGTKQLAQRFLKYHKKGCILTCEILNEIRTYKLDNDSRLEELCIKMSKKGKKNFFIEEHIDSTHICVAVVGTKAVAALVVEPPYIIGDGKNTIKSLIDQKNTLRSKNPYYSGNIIEFNDKLNQFVKRAGYCMDDVLPKDKKIQVGTNKNWMVDGDTTIITDSLHHDFKVEAEKVVEAIPGLKIAYVHMFVENHTMPKNNQNYVISRIDAKPNFLVFHYPWRGKPYNLAKDVANFLVTSEEIIFKKDRM